MPSDASIGQKQGSLWAVLAFGICAILAIASPVWVFILAYNVAKYLGSPQPQTWGTITAWFLLLLLPTYILGKALNVSYVSPNKKPVDSDSQKAKDNAGGNAQETKSPKPQDWADTQKDAPKTEALEAWKTAVAVQQHFNQLELQIRNFAVSLLAAVIGGAAFAVKEHYEISIGQIVFSAAVPILLAGVVGLLAFYFMDRYWYHNLLLGSVLHAIKIEKCYGLGTPELGLSTAIGKTSPENFRRFDIHSSEKIDLFYAAGLTLLIVITGGMMLAKHVGSDNISNATAGDQGVSSFQNQTTVYACPETPQTKQDTHKAGKKKTTTCPTAP